MVLEKAGEIIATPERLKLEIKEGEHLEKVIYNTLKHAWYLLTIRPNPLKIYMETHERIIESFIKKDANLVRSLVEGHITTNGEILQEHLGKIGR